MLGFSRLALGVVIVIFGFEEISYQHLNRDQNQMSVHQNFAQLEKMFNALSIDFFCFIHIFHFLIFFSHLPLFNINVNLV